MKKNNLKQIGVSFMLTILLSACGNNNQSKTLSTGDVEKERVVVVSNSGYEVEYSVDDETFIDEYEAERSQEMGVDEESKLLPPDGVESEEELALLDDGGVR